MPAKLLAATGLIALGVLGRLAPHLPNATPVNAATLAGTKYLGRPWAVAIPLLTMLISEACIGWYDWRILLSVYGSFMSVALLAPLTGKLPSSCATATSVLFPSVLFFIVTNFAVWCTSPWYEKNIAGLLYCYALGLPFLRSMLIGDVLWCAAIFGAAFAFAHARRRYGSIVSSFQTVSLPSSANA
jgi:hypothetical protein